MEELLKKKFFAPYPQHPMNIKHACTTQFLEKEIKKKILSPTYPITFSPLQETNIFFF